MVKEHMCTRDMFYHVIGFYFSAIWFVSCYADIEEDVISKPDVLSDDEIEKFMQYDIVKYIETFEEVALRARKSVEGMSQENPEQLYDEMTSIVQVIIDYNIHPNNAVKFLHAKGLSRVVAPNLRIAHVPLRRQLLMLTKQLFDISPSTVHSIIPLSILDNVLEIFENDDSLSVKAYALDVLGVWLPGNPKMQARVMRLKGLDPFYNQISKLDIAVIQSLLELFNKILHEHIAVRSEGRTAYSVKDRTLYQQIGLIERLSTGRVCDGLLNIFEKALPVIPESGDIVPSMFELVKMIEPFCLKTYKGKRKPSKVFNELLQFFTDEKTEKHFVERGVDVSEIRKVLENYVYELKQSTARDEL